MFVQIHMLQSVPPGNLNRDDSGLPKKCVFGGVTRGRISSQCLKRNIRLSPLFKEAFAEHLAVRSKYLPTLVANALRENRAEAIPEKEIEAVTAALAARFKKEEKARDSEQDTGEDDEAADAPEALAVTPQLVFFRPAFAGKIAELARNLRSTDPLAYKLFTKMERISKNDERSAKAGVEKFIRSVFEARESLSVDVALFGRMTTSDIVMDIEASCQVAHAIATHETLIESDYFTAMDDLNDSLGKGAGAAFLGSGDTETFFNSAVYYKYLNMDTGAFLRNLRGDDTSVASKAAAVLLEAAALSTPTGKQNSFAAHSVPELVLVEVSPRKQPISYANAFLGPVQGEDLMAASADALADYCGTVAAAFSPPKTQRFYLAVGRARNFRIPMEGERIDSLANLALEVGKGVKAANAGAK